MGQIFEWPDFRKNIVRSSTGEKLAEKTLGPLVCTLKRLKILLKFSPPPRGKIGQILEKPDFPKLEVIGVGDPALQARILQGRLKILLKFDQRSHVGQNKPKFGMAQFLQIRIPFSRELALLARN